MYVFCVKEIVNFLRPEEQTDCELEWYQNGIKYSDTYCRPIVLVDELIESN
jgi:hypothetical protein